MTQPHTDDSPVKGSRTEGAVNHTDTQQNTGNHRAGHVAPPAPGGTRQGAENVEPRVTNIEKGTDIDKLADLEEALDDSVSVNGPTERTAERDERGRQ